MASPLYKDRITLFPYILLRVLGLYAAAHDLEIEWIIIKAISEYADGNNSETDSWRQFASVMAASLTADILSDPIVFQSWPHYGGEVTDHWGSVLSPFPCHRSRPLVAFTRAAGSDERRLYSQTNNNSSFQN